MKTSELTEAALDWAVAKCEGLNPPIVNGSMDIGDCPDYSTDWDQGGLIIEREGITITHMGVDWENAWKARMGDGHWQGHDVHGPTPLVAAMRCFVASRLGDEVEIPEELCDENK